MNMKKILAALVLLVTAVSVHAVETLSFTCWAIDGEVTAFDDNSNKVYFLTADEVLDWLGDYADDWSNSTLYATIEEATHGTVTLLDVFRWAFPKNEIQVKLYRGFAYVSADDDNVAYSVPVTKANLRKARLLIASMM